MKSSNLYANRVLNRLIKVYFFFVFSKANFNQQNSVKLNLPIYFLFCCKWGWYQIGFSVNR